MKKTLTAILPGILLCALLAPPAFAQTSVVEDTPLIRQLRNAQADYALNQAAVRQGAKLATFCANCHGDNGNSTHPDTPNLAGQNPIYLLGQTLKFADGRRRYEWMEGLIKAMKPQEIIASAMFYARQPVTTKISPAGAALVAQGKVYYEKVCFRCHGPDGRGSETYARLAGQQESYVTLTLHRYRDGTGERTAPEMTTSTKLMNDEDIRAVAAYIASMK
ncbi:MAG: c-type cytochrome [Burkholderiaceae bacterium]|jgi:cytochrome c553|nr:c-type cytochrome [Burkholderiaceae bacterium]